MIFYGTLTQFCILHSIKEAIHIPDVNLSENKLLSKISYLSITNFYLEGDFEIAHYKLFAGTSS